MYSKMVFIREQINVIHIVTHFLREKYCLISLWNLYRKERERERMVKYKVTSKVHGNRIKR